MDAIQDFYSGVASGSTHCNWVVKNFVATNVVRPALRFVGLSGDDDDSVDSTDNPGLKVIGVGYGRTGTYSLTLALTELGFPTLHTQHMYESPAILDMWANDIFLPCIQADEAVLGSPNFDIIASHGYTATADLPLALYFEQLVEYYPESKFILTERENSEVWFRSWDTLTKAITQPTRLFRWMTHIKKINLYYRWLFSIVNKDNSFLSVPLPLPDQNKEQAIASYEEHNRRVREVVPPERLLVYNVKEGWEPLCKFLEVVDDCPTAPFPKTNSARSVQVQTVSAMVIPFAAVFSAVFFILYYLFKCQVNRVEHLNGNKKRLEKRNLAAKGGMKME